MVKFKLPSKKTVILGAIVFVVIAALIATALYAFSLGYKEGKYNKSKYSCSGGTASENINLNSLTYVCFENAVNINLAFLSGSGDEAEAAPVPEYKVEFLTCPMRLKLTLTGLSYWDYVVAGIPTDMTGVIYGAFQQSPTESGNETTLYFNLSSDVTYMVSTEDDILTVSLVPVENKTERAQFYILCDLFEDYREGTMPKGAFTPTLCSDRVSVLMISEPYSTQLEAEAQVDTYLTGDFEGVDMRVCELDAFGLPEYTEGGDDFSRLNESVLSVDGAKTTLPLFYSDARFLCWLPDGTGALFAKQEEGGEMLYVADKVGSRHQLIPECFATIVQAVYSSDGKYLAFVEQTEEVALVTLLNIESGELTVVGGTDGAQLLGTSIISIALNSNGTKLYCLSGEQIYSLKEYDVATKELAIMASSIVTESNIVYNGGYLYYCDVVDEMETIVRISTEGDMPRTSITHGSQFFLSPNGEYLAVITEDYETSACALRLVSLSDLSSVMILDDVTSTEFFIDADSKNVFYISETGDEEFYYEIMKYDIVSGQTSVCAQCVNAVFFPSNKGNEIVISVIYSSDGAVHPVTYLADFTSIAENTVAVDF